MIEISLEEKSYLELLKDRVLTARSAAIFAIWIVLSIVLGYLSGWGFLDPRNITSMLGAAPKIGIIALGMTMLLISGEFDLSVAQTFFFGQMTGAVLFTWYGLNPWLILIVLIIIGVLIGLLNGIIVTKFGVSSLIATLGTMWLFQGLTVGATGGSNVLFHPAREAGHEFFENLFTGNVFSIGGVTIRAQFIWMIIVAIVLYIILEHTRLGNELFSTGSNRQAAQMMGIRPDRTKIKGFIMVQVCTMLVAMIELTRFNGFYGARPSELNLEAIAASVIGGTSIYGGIGTVPGSFIGALILRWLRTGVVSIGLGMYFYYAVVGSVLAIVVAINIYLRKLSKK